ncbi:hypothetical protein [Desulfopila sp. IMCC35008]|uniref:hypothetical protein n=1 Tax=Desulfopila sp. IMCC35008 TaxID=2653858 RepID=UPI0013D857E5|nr:hypothetical protein [Desulfopila sp. IMCC35008]
MFVCLVEAARLLQPESACQGMYSRAEILSGRLVCMQGQQLCSAAEASGLYESVSWQFRIWTKGTFFKVPLTGGTLWN